MGFTIPGNDLATDPAIQSVWYDVDLAIIAAAMQGRGVLTGCAVTAQGSPDMTVAVAAGTIRNAGDIAATAVTGGNLTIGAASGSQPRIDLISVSSAGVKTVTAGTAAASPKPPDLPSGHIALAYVLVPTSDTTISTDQITDKRFFVSPIGLTKYASLSGNVTMTTANQAYDLVPLSLEEGVWALFGKAIFARAGGGGAPMIKIWDKASAIADVGGAHMTTSNMYVSCSAHGYLVLGSTTTIYLSALADTATTIAYADPASNDTSKHATSLLAVRVA